MKKKRKKMMKKAVMLLNCCQVKAAEEYEVAREIFQNEGKTDKGFTVDLTQKGIPYDEATLILEGSKEERILYILGITKSLTARETLDVYYKAEKNREIVLSEDDANFTQSAFLTYQSRPKDVRTYYEDLCRWGKQADDYGVKFLDEYITLRRMIKQEKTEEKETER